jgi:hypothetical protein
MRKREKEEGTAGGATVFSDPGVQNGRNHNLLYCCFTFPQLLAWHLGKDPSLLRVNEGQKGGVLRALVVTTLWVLFVLVSENY